MTGFSIAAVLAAAHSAGAGTAADRCGITPIATDLLHDPYVSHPHLALSADGFTAAYGTPDGVVIEELDSGVRTPVPSNPGDIEFSPALSADGTRLAYVAGVPTDSHGYSRPSFHVYLYDAATGTAATLTQQPGSNFQATISADGSTVAWANNETFVVHDLDAGMSHRGDVRIDDWVWEPVAISPDGSQLAYTWTGDLFLHDIVAVETRQVGPDRSFLHPRFLADGTRLAVESNDDLDGVNPDRQLRPVIYDLATGSITPAGAAPTPAWLPDPLVSSDGTHNVRVSRDDPAGTNPDLGDELFATDLATGTTSQLTSTGTDSRLDALAVSADGRRVAYASRTRSGPDRVMTLSIATTCDPAPRADAQIATAISRRYVGKDVYAVDATPAQRRMATISSGSRSFLVRLQNDRAAADTLTVSGQDAGDPGFRVRYRYRGAEVTEEVEAGTFSTGVLAARASVVLQVKIIAGPFPPTDARHHVDVTARSHANPVAVDTVRARVTVRR